MFILDWDDYRDKGYRRLVSCVMDEYHSLPSWAIALLEHPLRVDQFDCRDYMLGSMLGSNPDEKVPYFFISAVSLNATQLALLITEADQNRAQQEALATYSRIVFHYKRKTGN